MDPVKIIACGVFRSDLESLLSGREEQFHTEYLPGGLHTEPDRLREELQASLDSSSGRYGRIIIIYGLCGRGIVGLRSGLSNLVLPKVHDCISLFLGGTEEYRKQFKHAPGTYYISAGWYEEQIQPRGKNPFEGARGADSCCDGTEGLYPGQYVDTSDPVILEKRYGKDNAEEISDFLQSWRKNYSRAVYIDTGSTDEPRYEAHARNLAVDNDWEFLRLKGSRRLLEACLRADEDSRDILFVPPGHEIIQDMASGVAGSAPIGGTETLNRNETWTIGDSSDETVGKGRQHEIGLGVDAGGTYTDAVIYDFRSKKVLAKSKALTSRWKYSIGIMKAVKTLPEKYLDSIDLVSISTTLVTNAIVESANRPVGLFLMPNGNDAPPDLSHQPMTVIDGRMSISGEVLQQIKPEEVLRAAREMISRHRVEAFAISGYGGSVNPALELAVKEILHKATDMEVCCGHELSGTLNFSVRATTAVLNAGVMPIMEEFLKEMELSIKDIGIDAPLLVVRGDGSVMSESYAREFPVQTALSGPAASMAGARFLTGIDEALVVDIGGTTSDVGYLSGARVSICEKGARIGDWDTHIMAVDMLTAGLGGDSEIVYERLNWILGPRRVAPICSFPIDGSSIEKARKFMGDWSESTRPIQLLMLTGKDPEFNLSSRESAILDSLRSGPLMIYRIAEEIGVGSWRLVKSSRLEASGCVQRAGFTPTDLYHADGQMSLWSREIAESYLELVADAAAVAPENLTALIRRRISRQLGKVLLAKLLGNNVSESSGLDTILSHGNNRIEISPSIKIPVVGLGAPAALMTPESIEILGGNCILPENGDVANAVGAIASDVSVSRSAQITATPSGSYRINGLEGEDNHHETLGEAEDRCIAVLTDLTRERALKAGTSEQKMTMTVRSEIAASAEGMELFIARYYETELSGTPDQI